MYIGTGSMVDLINTISCIARRTLLGLVLPLHNVFLRSDGAILLRLVRAIAIRNAVDQCSSIRITEERNGSSTRGHACARERLLRRYDAMQCRPKGVVAPPRQQVSYIDYNSSRLGYIRERPC